MTEWGIVVGMTTYTSCTSLRRSVAGNREERMTSASSFPDWTRMSAVSVKVLMNGGFIFVTVRPVFIQTESSKLIQNQCSSDTNAVYAWQG